MKKVLLGLFICLSLFCLASISGVKLHAETGLEINSGASMRTAGEHQGLKFSASASSLTGVTEHGFYVVKGTHTKSDITSAIAASESTVGGDKLLKKEVVGEDLDFHLVIFNIDSLSRYAQPITVLAYTFDGSAYEYTNAVTKNLADVARAEYNANATPADLVTTVAEAAKVKVTHDGGAVNYFGTLADAISATFETGDTVELVRGTYTDTLTIDVNGFTITGPNADNDDFENRHLEANFTSGFEISNDIDGITINGIQLSGSAAIRGNSKGGITNLNIIYNYFGILSKTRNSLNGPLYFATGATSTPNFNFCIENNLFENNPIIGSNVWNDNYAGNHAETTIFIQDVEDFYYNNNIVKHFFNCIEVSESGGAAKGLFGVVEVCRNDFHSFAQFVLQIKKFDATTFAFEDNTCYAVDNCAGNDFAGVMRFYDEGTTTDKKISIKYNSFIGCFGWHMIRFASLSKTKATITYNLFKSDKHSGSTIYVVQNAGSASVVTMGWNCYLVEDGSAVSTAMSGNKGTITVADGSVDFTTEAAWEEAIK